MTSGRKLKLRYWLNYFLNYYLVKYKYPSFFVQIKAEVFEILKEELQNLKLAVDRDKKGKKGKKGKGGKGNFTYLNYCFLLTLSSIFLGGKKGKKVFPNFYYFNDGNLPICDRTREERGKKGKKRKILQQIGPWSR